MANLDDIADLRSSLLTLHDVLVFSDSKGLDLQTKSCLEKAIKYNVDSALEMVCNVYFDNQNPEVQARTATAKEVIKYAFTEFKKAKRELDYEIKITGCALTLYDKNNYHVFFSTFFQLITLPVTLVPSWIYVFSSRNSEEFDIRSKKLDLLEARIFYRKPVQLFKQEFNLG